MFTADPAQWKINDFFREHLARHGADQNKNADFTQSKRVYKDGSTRYLSLSAFTRTMQNGEEFNRPWLIYSESKCSVFCAPCLLFGDHNQSSFSSKDGFNDWKNTTMRVEKHENSREHKECVLKLKERSNVLMRVDRELTAQLDEEISYWRKVLERVVAAIKFLVSRGHPLRGHEEKIGSTRNGNFLMLMEFLSEFDPFMKEHLKKYAEKGSGHVNYLSKTIYEEFIEIMAEELRAKIIEELKKAKYYSIIVDSTPDISHIDQLSFILRYVLPSGAAVERFLKLIDNPGHKGEDMFDAVLETLAIFDIDILNMRGQSYDNAANMRGIYKGLQSRIQKENPLADYVPCAGHGLNIIGSNAAKSCPEAVKFFDLTQALYNFFSASPDRWKILQTIFSKTKTTLKSLSATRWSARADAVQALVQSWKEVYEVLKSIESNNLQKAETRSTAKGLREKLENMETAFMLVFWSTLLNRFNVVSQKIQGIDTTMEEVLDLYQSLILLIDDTRENFDLYEEKAKELSINKMYTADVKRKKHRLLQADETNEGYIEFHGRNNFRINSFVPILDALKTDLTDRLQEYQAIFKKFSALLKFGELDGKELRIAAEKLRKHFEGDLEGSFIDELIHFQLYCIGKGIEKNSPGKLLLHIHKNELQSLFPNVDIAYRIFMSTAVTNCSAERSFSCLKRIKNYLRSTMTEERLNHLMILAIESELFLSLDFTEIIRSFAEGKARKKFV